MKNSIIPSVFTRSSKQLLVIPLTAVVVGLCSFAGPVVPEKDDLPPGVIVRVYNHTTCDLRFQVSYGSGTCPPQSTGTWSTMINAAAQSSGQFQVPSASDHPYYIKLYENSTEVCMWTCANSGFGSWGSCSDGCTGAAYLPEQVSAPAGYEYHNVEE
jgi:hypothetical protein